MIIIGFSNRQWENYIEQQQRISKYANAKTPSQMPQKQFIQSNENLPVLESYSGVIPDTYWGAWEKRSYEDLTPTKSWICPDKLDALAKKLDYTDVNGRLARAKIRLSKGARIGCEGPSRLPTRHPNSKTAVEYGARVADSLQSWIKEGLCFGPLLPHEMPWDDFTTNSITVKLKPNGKARICINMSAPYKKASDPTGAPSSVNS